MITWKPPWHGSVDPAAVVYRIGFFGEEPEIPSYVSEQGRDFLGKCLKRDPSERWSVEELLGHETAPHEARDCPSLRDRIRRLFSNEPVCAWNDDEWVTVRGNEVHDMQLEGEGLSFTKRTPLFVMKRMFW
ncbi:Mitogen-activated protein kinase kinase kinase 18 [Glycine max]|nr:Mitogen-activated protein kinase kinase kinase 18 [Glycine max]